MRKYEFDNLKFLMIFLVVFGHLLEILNAGISRNLYILIYTFHIPVFVFVSGYFFKFKPKNIIKYVIYYIIWQVLYSLFDIYFLKTSQAISFKVPYWILWYLISLISWCLITKLFDVKSNKIKVLLLLVSFSISILSGFLFTKRSGYDFSISRTLTYFPYFLLGFYLKNSESNFLSLKSAENKLNIKKFSIVLLIFIICFAYFITNINNIEFGMLYGSHGYKELHNYTPLFKTILSLFSLSIIILLLNFISKKKLPIISDIGKSTLIVYLLHGFIIKTIHNKLKIFVFSDLINILISFILSIVIVLLFGYLLPILIQKIKAKFSNKKATV